MDAFLALFGQVERAEIPHPVVQSLACVLVLRYAHFFMLLLISYLFLLHRGAL